MSRAYSGIERRAVFPSFSSPPTPSESSLTTFREARSRGTSIESWVVRAFLVACAAAICVALRPFQLGGLMAAGVGVLLAAVILVAEVRLQWAGADCWAAS